MSNLNARLKRLERANCTFVTHFDWKLMANEHRSILEQGGKNPDDYNEVVAEIEVKVKEFLGKYDDSGYHAYIQDLAAQDYYAYHAFFYFRSQKVVDIPFVGTWASNKKRAVALAFVMELRKKHRAQRDKSS